MKIFIGSEKDIRNNLIDRIEINEKLYVVHYFQKVVYVFDSRCPHAQGNLLFGTFDNEYIICPSHGIRFNMKNGKANIDEIHDDFLKSIQRIGIDTIILHFLPTINENGNVYALTE
jgi:nitrite reductase/ring-hydroxylating ferredoxin subunit